MKMGITFTLPFSQQEVNFKVANSENVFTFYLTPKFDLEVTILDKWNISYFASAEIVDNSIHIRYDDKEIIFDKHNELTIKNINLDQIDFLKKSVAIINDRREIEKYLNIINIITNNKY